MAGDFWNGQICKFVNVPLHKVSENTGKIIKINFLDCGKLTSLVTI